MPNLCLDKTVGKGDLPAEKLCLACSHSLIPRWLIVPLHILYLDVFLTIKKKLGEGIKKLVEGSKCRRKVEESFLSAILPSQRAFTAATCQSLKIQEIKF